MSLILDELLESVYNIKVSLAVVVPNVSSLEVSLIVEHLAGLLLLAHVPLHVVWSLHADLALLVRWESLP